jgi:hypothetical protein
MKDTFLFVFAFVIFWFSFWPQWDTNVPANICQKQKQQERKPNEEISQIQDKETETSEITHEKKMSLSTKTISTVY